MNDPNGQIYKFDLETQPFELAMRQLEDSTRKFGSLFSSTMRNAVQNGKGFEGVLKSLASRMADMALSQAFRPLDNLVSSGISSIFSSFAGAGRIGGGFAGSGGIGAPMNITPFAKGGVFGSPNYFSFGSRIGVMGEKGSEAVLPLARGADGRLGVMAGGGGAGNITFNVVANDAASFRKSEGQVSAMLARVVKRGQLRL